MKGLAASPRGKNRSDPERGVTLLEILVVLTMLAVVSGVTANYALEWIRREKLRSALYTVSSQLELARLEALNRNRSCRVIVDTDEGQVQVVDLNQPGDPTDDTVLASARLPEGVRFAAPGGGAAVTFELQPDGRYAATYSAGGVVTAGAGQVVLAAGGRYGRVTLFVAGGTQVEHWADGGWHAGS
ncbi:MAG: prepilin-type N-terminal cleavage/methylation domain-containing protein [Acidobacteria bacterium]|nr:MAG: prepilin-type N-terminal cleavage/methylation domain-containing protein [Acidobacteriota bacterium]